MKFPRRFFAVIVLASANVTVLHAGTFFQDFSGSSVGATNFTDGSQLFVSAPFALAGVRDAVYTELQLTDAATGSTHVAYLLPDLDLGTNVYAFSVKWNGLISGNFPNAADGVSLTFGQVRSLNLTNDTYAQESGFSTGLTFSVRTYFGSAPGFYLHVNNSTVTSAPYIAGTQWGTNSTRRHFFEVDWNYLSGLSVTMDGSNIFSNIATPGFTPQPGDSFVFAARTGGLTETARVDNIVVMTGGNLKQVPMVAPYFKSGEFLSATQTADKAFDNVTSTKWLTFNSNGFVGATCSGGVRKVRVYALTVAEDFPGRDPKTWTLDGSNDAGTNWIPCGTGGGSFVNRNSRGWLSTNNSAFGAFRLNVPVNNGGTEIQLAELKLYEFIPQTFVGTPGLPFVEQGSSDWGDYNNDGLIDFVTSGSGAQPAQVWRNDGNGKFSFAFTVPVSLQYAGSIKWGDYNNDGYLDLVAVSELGSKLLRNQNGTNFVAVPLNGFGAVSKSSVAWSDYDNDGRLDFSVVGDFYFTLWHNDGGDSFTPNQVPGLNVPTDVGPPSGGGYEWYYADTKDIVWLDYNADGRLDFLFGGGNKFQLWRNIGNGNFLQDTNSGLPVIEQPGFYCFGLSINAGDLNADGYPDVIFACDSWRRVYLNDGAGHFTYNYVSVWDPAGGYFYQTVRLADVNGDGLLDLTGHYFDHNSWYIEAGPLGNYSRQTILLADGLGGFTNFSPVSYYIPYSPNHAAMAWADSDRDGRMDILLNSGASLAWRNLTGSSNSAPSAPGALVSSVTGSIANLSWAPGSDATTPSTGLTYSVRIGSGPGLANIMNPSASTSGLRRLARVGNAGQTKNLSINLPPGTYYWSVQSVDNSWDGSPFAGEQNFFIPLYAPRMITGYVKNTRSQAADVYGVINSATGAMAWCEFGLTPAYGKSTLPQALSANVSATTIFRLRELNPTTVYYARSVVSNSQSLAFGPDLVFTTTVQVSVADLTVPGDTYVANPGYYFGSQEADKFIDNSIHNRMLCEGYSGAGFTVTPSGGGLLRSIMIGSSFDPSRDMGSFMLEGSIDGVNFVTLIPSNNIPPYSSTYALQMFPVQASTPYDMYRLTFLSAIDQANAGGAVHVGEIELLNFADIISTGDTINVILPAGASLVRPGSKLINRSDAQGDDFEVSGVTNSVVVDIIPGVGRTLLKSFEIIGSYDDAFSGGTTPSNIVVAGSDDGVTFHPIATGYPFAPSTYQITQEFSASSNIVSYARYRITFGKPISGTTLRTGELRLFGLPVASQLDAWRFVNFGTTNNSGNAANGADPDGDGDQNLLEFASGTNPGTTNSSPLFRIETSNGNPRIYYMKDATAISNVTWSIQSVANLLNNWSNRNGNSQEVDSNEPIRTIRFDPAPPVITGELYRLNVTSP